MEIGADLLVKVSPIETMDGLSMDVQEQQMMEPDIRSVTFTGSDASNQ